VATNASTRNAPSPTWCNPRTRPYAFATPGGDRFKFAAFSDCRESYGGGLRNYGGTEALALQELASHAFFQGVDFGLVVGDLVNGYTTSTTDFELMLSAFQRALEPLWARVPLYVGMGNHEACLDVIRFAGGGLTVDKEGDDSIEAIFARTFVHPTNGPTDEGPGSPPYPANRG